MRIPDPFPPLQAAALSSWTWTQVVIAKLLLTIAMVIRPSVATRGTYGRDMFCENNVFVSSFQGAHSICVHKFHQNCDGDL